MNRLFGNKKARYRNLLLVLLPFLLGIGIFGFMAKDSLKSTLDINGTVNEEPVSNEYSIPAMGFTLRSNATEFQKEQFAKLKEAVEKPNSELNEYQQKCEIVGGIAANFIADYYTWTNKYGSYDVGGMTYWYQSPSHNTRWHVFTQSRKEFYKYVSYYINEYGADQLIEVDSITIKNACYMGDFATSDGVLPQYSVDLSWTYKSGSAIDTKDLLTRCFVTILELDDGTFRIAEVYPE